MILIRLLPPQAIWASALAWPPLGTLATATALTSSQASAVAHTAGRVLRVHLRQRAPVQLQAVAVHYSVIYTGPLDAGGPPATRSQLACCRQCLHVRR